MAWVNCSKFDDWAAAYALGALDDTQMRSIQRHLEHCTRTHQSLAEAYDLAAILSLTLDPVEPSAGLKIRLTHTIRLLAQVEAEARSALVNQQPARKWSDVFTQLIRSLRPLTAAGMAMALVLGVMIGSYSLSARSGATATAWQALNQAEQVYVARGAAGAGWLTQAGDEALFVVANMQPLPNNTIYEMWLIDQDGNPVAAGIFGNAPPGSVIPLELPSAGFAAFAVTIEQERVTAPSSEPLLMATLKG